MYSLSSLVNGGLVSSFTVVLERSILTAARVPSVDDDLKAIDMLLFDFGAATTATTTAAAAFAAASVVAAVAAVCAVAVPHCSVDLTSIFAYTFQNNADFQWGLMMVPRVLCSRARWSLVILSNYSQNNFQTTKPKRSTTTKFMVRVDWMHVQRGCDCFSLFVDVMEKIYHKQWQWGFQMVWSSENIHAKIIKFT